MRKIHLLLAIIMVNLPAYSQTAGLTVQIPVQSVLNARPVTTLLNGHLYNWDIGIDGNGNADGYLTKSASLFVGDKNPALISVPPLVYHGFKGIGTETAYFLSVPTEPYNYSEPDEFRLPPDTDQIPYDWGLTPGLKHG